MTFDFDRAIVGSIPLHMQAEAWFSVKHAGIGDPPDETGAVEGRFPVPVAQVLEGLAELVKAKATIMYAYATYAQTIRGPDRGELAENFKEFAADDLEDMEWYLRRMASLGGGAQLPDVPAPPAVTDPLDAVKLLLRLEQETVAKLAALKELVGENPMKYELEAFMAEEQMHVDRLWQHMPYEAKPEQVAGDKSEAEDTKSAHFKIAAIMVKGAESRREMEDIHELRGSMMASSNPVAKAFARKKKIVGGAKGVLGGSLLGTALGVGAGAAMKKGPRAKKILAALGALGGGAAGGAAGSEMAGARANRTISKAAMAMRMKLALNDMEQSEDNLSGSADLDTGQEHSERPGKPVADPTKYLEGNGSPAVDPALSEYIEQEQAAQNAEQQNAAEYYKEIADQATQESQAVQQQLMEAQSAAAMAQQQAAQLSQQVQDTQQQAQAVQQQAVQTAAMAQSTAANSQAQAIKAMQDVLLHKQLATNMRQGVMMMKDQIQSALMSDPTAGAETQIAGPPPGPPPGSPGGEVPSEGPPSPEQGPAAGSPAPPTAPAGGPNSPGQPPAQTEGKQGNTPQTPPEKQASAARKMLEVAKRRAPYAVPGALIGGGATYAATRSGAADKLKAEVDKQQAASKRGELGTSGESDLARNKMRLAYSEFAKKNPRAAAATGAAVGAGALATAGPPIRRLAGFVRRAMKNKR